MKTEWSGFGVSPKDLIDKTVRECAYDYYERHKINRHDIKILKINFTEYDNGGLLYEAEIEYDETRLTESELTWAGIYPSQDLR